MKFWIYFWNSYKAKNVPCYFQLTSDIEKIADDVVLIHQGKMIFEKVKDKLIYDYNTLRLQVK